MIRVLLAEDQAMVRGALAALLSREQDFVYAPLVVRVTAHGASVLPYGRNIPILSTSVNQKVWLAPITSPSGILPAVGMV